MLTPGSSLLDLSDFSADSILSLFEQAKLLKSGSGRKKLKNDAVISLLFFESSTRTRVSFEMAAHRMGASTSLLDANSGSSLSKGESELDTVLNVAAMKPDALVIRAGDEFPMSAIGTKIRQPIINAGWGQRGHPTQALLDIFTIWERRKVEKIRWVFLGDIRHSRVVASHLELCKKLDIEVAGCGPNEFRPDIWSHQWFGDLDSALDFAEVVFCLRVQKERHDATKLKTPSWDGLMYSQKFGLRKDNINKLWSRSFIMHPGPINYGIEMSEEIAQDERSLILQQVENGVYLRQTLLQMILGV